MSSLMLFVGVVENREFAIRTALESGLRLAVIDFATAPMMQLAHIQIPVDDLFGPEELQRAFDRLPERPDGVLTFYDELLEPTAVFAEKNGCVFMSPRAARLALNKVAQRQALTEAGLPCPQWVTCDTLEEATAAAARTGYPVALKTADQAGAIGKVLVADETLLPAAYEQVHAARLDLSVPLLVEELLTGPEYSIEGFVRQGEATAICVTEKTTLPGPVPIVIGHALPYRGPDERELTETAIAAALALGIDNSVIHVELFATARGPMIVEVNARTAGDRLMDMIHRRSGANPYHAAYGLALGQDFGWTPRWEGAEAMLWAVPERGGVLAGFDGVPDVLREPSLKGLAFAAGPGMTLPDTPEHVGHRLNWVICEGADWREASTRARATLARVTPRFANRTARPAPPPTTAHEECVQR
ncbi:Alanine-anticapsin ligase BacD [Streptomyces sp. ADI96-15]|uniref:ATP-grasp domain-containing protein n=1 Tax=Streptomyces sp. ADI96-15 TaxID=1522761 RepID=UPI000F55899E|nr:ATP-grasp domain-containing protein [Streptomyces sp. ADI96-15]RPK66916.1 Alanine-anticapsin ligase BacD [Streptomyces sp. ADI96-15]